MFVSMPPYTPSGGYSFAFLCVFYASFIFVLLLFLYLPNCLCGYLVLVGHELSNTSVS